MVKKIIVCWFCKEKDLQKAKGLCKKCYFFYWRKTHKDLLKRYNYNKSHRSKKEIKCIECGNLRLHEAYNLCKNCCSKKRYYRIKKGKKYRLSKKQAKRKRKLKIRQLRENFSQKDWDVKVLETEGICPECKKYVGIEEITLDHIIPISKARNGFVYRIEDVQPLCRSCNASKGMKSPYYAEKSLGSLGDFFNI